MKTSALAALALFLIVFARPTPAQAYLDPATGGMIVSGVVAVFATLAMALKTYWHKLRALVRGSAVEPDPPEGNATRSDAGDLPRA
jgi:hypothetical protein